MNLFAEDLLIIGQLRDHGYPWKEISRILGFTMGAAKTAYKRQTAKSKKDYVGIDYKGKAREKLKKAIKTGFIVRPVNCEKCGKIKKRIIGHHTDYSKPLDVIWLCASCHGYEHPEREVGRRQFIRELIPMLNGTPGK